jgi:hypothetical protein
MQYIVPVDDRYLQVRRVIASIAYENQEIDEQERVVLASDMAGQYQLAEDQVQTLIEDAVSKPRIEDLVNLVNDPRFLRLLLTDLMTLAIAKEEWEESELAAAVRAIGALHLRKDLVAKVRQAFDLLIDVTGQIEVH